jgi:hypothetical protein
MAEKQKPEREREREREGFTGPLASDSSNIHRCSLGTRERSWHRTWKLRLVRGSEVRIEGFDNAQENPKKGFFIMLFSFL